MQNLIVQYYISTILNSVTITIAITTSATTASTISKSRILKQCDINSATSNSEILK